MSSFDNNRRPFDSWNNSSILSWMIKRVPSHSCHFHPTSSHHLGQITMSILYPFLTLIFLLYLRGKLHCLFVEGVSRLVGSSMFACPPSLV